MYDELIGDIIFTVGSSFISVSPVQSLLHGFLQIKLQMSVLSSEGSYQISPMIEDAQISFPYCERFLCLSVVML